MKREYRIRRHGYHLMSLASMGIAGVAVFGLLLVCMPWLRDWNPQSTTWLSIARVEWTQMQEMGAEGRGLLSTAYLVWTLAVLSPLLALRHLGSTLYRQEALTRPVARAFMRLAHSLPANALLSFASGILVAIACEVGGIREHRFDADISGGYLFLVACLCLYSFAHLMSLASEAADDARSIV